jgi:cell wall-associated NlpC family hydrolase
MAALAARTDTTPVAVQASARMTLTRFDALLVSQLGLGDVAAHVERTAKAAGLTPPGYFGTEVVARYLGLRDNHPAGEDSLELYPSVAFTRAVAAHSLAVVLEAGEWSVQAARETLEAFSLPRYSSSQLQVLRVAVSKIGMPYIWGGETDGVSSTFGYQAHGGYDCSGFVWRVFKLSGNPAGAAIGGRTAAQMAGEIPKSQRIHLEDLQPGDLIFFGKAKFNGKATEASVVHVGIALSPHWMIHSSAQGVYVSSLDEQWRRDEFAWARRVL